MPRRGLVSAVKRVLFGEANQPKAKRYSETSTPTQSTYYQGMDQDYRWFRQDELTRRCMATNALFATVGGFETTLESESPDNYTPIKETVDEINKRVNLDKLLHDAQIKRSIHGRTAYELAKTDRIQFNHSEGAHDDSFWALALAMLAANANQASRTKARLYHSECPPSKTTGN